MLGEMIKTLYDEGIRLSKLDVTSPEAKDELSRSNSLSTTTKAFISGVRTAMEAREKGYDIDDLIEDLMKEEK